MNGSLLYKSRIYLSVGKFLHIITIIELAIMFLAIPTLLKTDTPHDLFLTGLRYHAVAFLVSLPVFSQLDARSRFQNYKQIKDQIYLYGFDTRILKPVLKSRCQRDAALVSATELGCKKECTDYFKSYGYRWYHLIPDFVFTHPQFLFSKYFWLTTFFVKGYQPKVDYPHSQPKYLKISLTNA